LTRFFAERVLCRSARAGAVGALAAFGVVAGTNGTQDAIANGDTRTISFVHMHSKEELTVTFKRWGQYDSSALAQLNRFLRDWRNDAQTRMDPRLFDVLWQVMRKTGSSGPVNVLSAYRSPTTNAMLARRSRGVAKASRHIAGQALDFRLTDINMREAREMAVQLQMGGVGFYPSSHTPFMHIDVGSVRSWPRLSRDQLARIFPDGKTVHLPAGGGTMPGYELARAEIIARGGSVGGYVGEGEEGGGYTGPRKSLWATLFGGADEAEDVAEAANARRGVGARRGGGTRVAAAPPPAAPVGGGDGGDSAGAHTFFAAAQQPAAPAAIPAARTRLAAARAQPVEPSPPTPAPTPVVVAAPAKPDAKIETRLEPAKPDVKPAQVAALGPKTWLPAVAPVPTSRPRNLEALAAAIPDAAKPAETRLVAIPLPPERPTALAAVAAPEEKPVEKPVAKPVLVAMPLPPARPAGAASVSDDDDGATRRAAAERPATLAFAAAPAERSGMPAAVLRGITPPAAKPAPARPSMRTELRQLVTTAAATPAKAQPEAPVRVARVKAEEAATPPSSVTALPTKTIRMSFSSGVDSDLVTGSFTGPAVKALPTIGFTR
jgi:uncharacterized protein YcbK (DUF882 family)